jgi:hypothetical protein
LGKGIAEKSGGGSRWIALQSRSKEKAMKLRGEQLFEAESAREKAFVGATRLGRVKVQ